MEAGIPNNLVTERFQTPQEKYLLVVTLIPNMRPQVFMVQTRATSRQGVRIKHIK